MNTRLSQLATIAATFAAGFAAGILLAPSSGRELREDLGAQARQKLDVAEKKLAEVESRLNQLNESIGETTNEWSEKLRTSAEETMSQHVPDLSLDSEKWDLEESEMKRELRHLAR